MHPAWRFHVAHHADLELSASTAHRFHFAKMVLSGPWRSAQVLLIDIRPVTLKTWQTATLIEILFHHSDLWLTHPIERFLMRLIVTAPMHGIPHSSRRDETNFNWLTGLTPWNWLHGTLKLDVPRGDHDRRSGLPLP